MSIFHPVTIRCRACGAQTQIPRSASVNADRRPDLRAAILDGGFQAAPCSGCGAVVRLPPHLTYLELRAGLWIMVEPAERLEEWAAIEAEGAQTYARTFGREASPSGRSLGEGVKPRLVFGWPALREKLIARGLGLDDAALEALKMAIMRSVDDAPIADETELRLTGGSADTLTFAWVVAATEEQLNSLDVPRELYDEIAADEMDWADVRDRFDGVLLVDLRRFIAGAVPAAA